MIKGLVQVDLTDASLQVVVDALDAEMVEYAGPHEPAERTIYRDGRTLKLWLKGEPAHTVASVRQGYGAQSEDYGISLSGVQSGGEFFYSNPEHYVAVTTYKVTDEGFALMRTDGYTWLDRVEVRYTPKDRRPLRRGVLIDLLKLELAYQGVRQTTYGRSSRMHFNQEAERARILSRLDYTAGGIGLIA